MNDTLLEINHVTKSFKDGEQNLTVLNQVSLKVERGNLIAIVGPSGSGKTTLLSIAGLLQSVDEGEICINKKRISQKNEKEKSRIRLNEIGFIFQQSNLIPYLTVEEQLKLVLKLAKKSWEQHKIYVAELLESMGILHKKSHYPHQLSGGQKQRVAIARSLINNPSIILADEPTASLDSSRSFEVMSLLANEIKKNQKAGIVVTHDETILPLCDQVFYMKDGRIHSLVGKQESEKAETECILLN